IFARNLSRYRRGLALYDPSPSRDMLSVYLQSGIPIGSLGIITDDGGFDFLFNACAPADDPINADGVPPGFVHFSLLQRNPLRETSPYGPGTILSGFKSKTTALRAGAAADMFPLGGAGAEFEIRSTKSEGAILALPDRHHGVNACDLRALPQLRAYAAKYAASWYTYAETRGFDLTSGSLYVVTGRDTCRSWELASFDNRERG
ncbi:hypothetical protein C8J56DRAFT_755846, partial [Mycena floridula]